MYTRVLGQLHHTKSIYSLYERFKKLMKIDLNFGSYVKLIGTSTIIPPIGGGRRKSHLFYNIYFLIVLNLRLRLQRLYCLRILCCNLPLEQYILYRISGFKIRGLRHSYDVKISFQGRP